MVRTFDEVTKPTHPAGSLFLHNCYFGPWKNGLPDDPEALVADPQFLAPGTGGNGLCTLEGYTLKETSPCINTGKYVPLNGGRDFFGNPVEDGHPDFGAFEAVGTGVFSDSASEAEQDRKAAALSAISWAKWYFPEAVYADDSSVLTIRLKNPLEEGISGTVSLVPAEGKTQTVSLDKLKDRGSIEIKTRLDKAELLESSVRLNLTNGDFTEEWEISVKDINDYRRR